MDDLLSEFLTETSENLAVLDVELVKLERNPNDMELLGNIFRLVHTVKGTCGFLGLPRLELVAHAGENILGKLRDGELVASPEAVTAVLECLDRIRSIMSDLETNGSEPEGEDSALIQRLNHIAEGGAAPEVAKPAPAPTPAAPKSQPKAASRGSEVRQCPVDLRTDRRHGHDRCGGRGHVLPRHGRPAHQASVRRRQPGPAAGPHARVSLAGLRRPEHASARSISSARTPPPSARA